MIYRIKYVQFKAVYSYIMIKCFINSNFSHEVKKYDVIHIMENFYRRHQLFL